MLVSPRISNKILLGRLFHTSIGYHDLRVYFFSGHRIKITIVLEMSLNYGLFICETRLYSNWIIHELVIDFTNKVIWDFEAIIPIIALGLFNLKQVIDLVVNLLMLKVCGLFHIARGSTTRDRCLFLIEFSISVIFIHVHL